MAEGRPAPAEGEREQLLKTPTGAGAGAVVHHAYQLWVVEVVVAPQMMVREVVAGPQIGEEMEEEGEGAERLPRPS